MKCTICGGEVVLYPSARARAEQAKQRGQGAPYTDPKYYTELFPTHAECAIHKRAEETIELIRQLNTGETQTA